MSTPYGERDIFIGNTRPDANEDLIKQALVKCGENQSDMPSELKEGDIMVKLLNNLAEEPNPRTKCWKVTVPYIFKDVMAVDTFFPSGWSHRKFHNQVGNKKDTNKRPRQSGQAGGPGQDQSNQDM